MGQTDKKLKNQLFKVAVDYIYKEHLANGQGELAKKIGISESALSRIMNDKKFVSDDTLRKMNEAFGGIFNMAYFRGEDPQCMLIEDLLYYQQHPEKRLVFVKPKKENVSQSEPDQPLSQDTTLIMSKMFESMLKPIEAAHAQQVATLNQQIADKQSIIDLQADKIKSQAAEIASLQKVIDDLRAMPSSYDIEEYIRNNPFSVGVAEKQEQPRAQV
jgi:transcriptional regulator with XRE-family HTH domain